MGTKPKWWPAWLERDRQMAAEAYSKLLEFAYERANELDRTEGGHRHAAAVAAWHREVSVVVSEFRR